MADILSLPRPEALLLKCRGGASVAMLTKGVLLSRAGTTRRYEGVMPLSLKRGEMAVRRWT